MWRQLHDQIASRQDRLHSASEIHKFTNDLDDLMDRIQEKDNSLFPDDVGKDAGTVQVLQRQHEVFEHELKPTENEVLTILSESKRLKNAYKGLFNNELTCKKSCYILLYNKFSISKFEWTTLRSSRLSLSYISTCQIDLHIC